MGDVPVQVKKQRVDPATAAASAASAQAIMVERPEAKEIWFGKVAATVASREKQLETEIPELHCPLDRPAFVEDERKQWQEHLDFCAVRVLSKAETAQVLEEVPPERILNARFALKSKARAQRLKNPEVPVKAKARLCVGGHRDPDLGVRPLAIDRQA